MIETLSSERPQVSASPVGRLAQDSWTPDAVSSHISVSTEYIGNVARAASAVSTIARIVHNSLQEPAMTGAEPLGFLSHLGLLDALEIVGAYLTDVTQAAREDAMVVSGSD